ncbi:MAG: ATP-dependent Clp protease ATP-binding subunit [Patescibacteria group bacterium]
MHQLFHKFTSHLKEALLRAYHVAQQEQRMTIAPRHLLLSLASQNGSLAAELLHKRGLREEVYLDTPILADVDPGSIELSEEAKDIVQKMVSIAFEYQHHYVGTEHLLAAIVFKPSRGIADYLIQKNINQRELKKELEQILTSTSHFSEMTELFSEAGNSLSPEQVLVGQDKQRPQSMLETFTRDLTTEEAQRDIDPVIGREKEIERLIHVLSRRNKNNPLLLGEPGVGKTAIVEGLAKRIVDGDVPAVLQGKRIVTLDLSLMVAGTMYRGEFESRLKQALDELQKSPDTIIFIDEIHTIVGAGSSTGGSLDAANILKPSLARGHMRCIGATTIAEYRKTIESDPALSRRFQPIMVHQQTIAETEKVLKGIRKYYETFHTVSISDATIKAAIELSNRYIHDRQLPDKAIDLIDEASAQAKVASYEQVDIEPVRKLEKKIHELENEKDVLVSKEQFDEAWEIKKQQKQLEKKLAKQKVSYKGVRKNEVTPTMIARVVSHMTGIPLEHIEAQTGRKVDGLEKKLSKRVVGQDHAIKIVSKALRRAQAGLAKTHRPLGTFMFMGPTGVGKTQLAKTLAEEVFQSPESLIRVDMSEFSEKFTISKLIGAPAGYVGYKESGMLTERVKRRPYSVVLFDEIEKAHPDIYNVLLQILDEGSIVDASGQRIDFTNTIIIMTSNIGAERFNIQARLGFDRDASVKELESQFTQLRKTVVKELDNHFKPEFLNRLDHVVVFNPLTIKDLVKIVDLEIKDLRMRLKRHDVKLKVGMPVKKRIAEEGFSPHKGAREIARRVEERIEHPLIEKILEEAVATGDKVEARSIEDNIELAKV